MSAPASHVQWPLIMTFLRIATLSQIDSCQRIKYFSTSEQLQNGFTFKCSPNASIPYQHQHHSWVVYPETGSLAKQDFGNLWNQTHCNWQIFARFKLKLNKKGLNAKIVRGESCKGLCPAPCFTLHTYILNNLSNCRQNCAWKSIWSC